ncbi:FAD dependent oxidoreductase [Biscogniauxia mediterranea]|nr:FAD dependent oxidoreductase [Biscogniauxia mediterranea]
MRAAMPGDDAAVYRLLEPAEVAEKYFCAGGGKKEGDVCGGVAYEAGSLSAYKFGVGVLKLCLAEGLNLQTNTPALGLERVSGESTRWRWRVDTDRGPIAAKRVVVATNGYTARLLERFQGVIIPLRGHVTAQRPGRAMPKEGLPATYSFIYEKGYDYMIPRPPGSKFAGDIVIGGSLVKAPRDGLDEYGTTDDTVGNEVIFQALRESLPRYFGDNWGEDDPEGRIRTQWSGIMGYGSDGFPFVGEMPGQEGLWVSCGFQGHGMVLCWMCARGLVAMMEGRDDEELRSWFPDVFRVSEKRLSVRFKGYSHTGTGPISS